MSLDHQKFPHHPVATEQFEMRGSSTIFPYYNYRVDTNIGKVVRATILIPCAFGCQIVLHHIKQGMTVIKTVTITQYLNIKIIGSSCNS